MRGQITPVWEQLLLVLLLSSLSCSAPCEPAVRSALWGLKSCGSLSLGLRMWFAFSLPTGNLCCDLAFYYFPLPSLGCDHPPLKAILNFGVLVPEEKNSHRRSSKRSFQRPLPKLESMTFKVGAPNDVTFCWKEQSYAFQLTRNI